MPARSPFPPRWRPEARGDVDFRHIDDAWLLYDPRSGDFHTLDAADALIWSFCTGEWDVAGIEDQVREAFGIARPDPGVARALRSFLDAGLLLDPIGT